MIKQFNGYQIDLTEKILLLDEQEVEIEPLVMDVLVYLIESRDRYIDIQELHESLWVDKIVSDSAIRRTIVKLRSILNDDSSNPTYIKSATRKGYRFICELEDIEQPPEQGTTLEPPLLVETPEYPSISAETINLGKSPFFTLFGLLFLIASVIFWWMGSNKPAVNKPKQQSLNLEVEDNLIDLYGKSLSPALHQNRPLIAFSHKNQRKEFYDLFVFNVENSTFVQLTNGGYSYLNPVWKGEDQIITMAVNNSECKIVEFTLVPGQQKAPEQTLYQCADGQPNLNYHAQDNALYFSDKSELGTALSLYKLKLPGKDRSIFSTPAEKGIGDYISAISNDGSHLAFARTIKGDETTIFIENIDSGKLTGQLNLKQDILSMYWFDEQRLLILTSGKLWLFDSKTHSTVTAQIPQSIIGIHANHQTPSEPVVVKSNQQKYMLEEINNPHHFDSSNARIISYSGDKLSAVYADTTDDVYYLTHQQNDQGKNYFLHTSEEKFVLPIDQAKEVELLAVNSSKENALLRIDKQVALYVFVTEKLNFLTKEINQVINASFSHDGQSVLYALKESDAWSVKRFNLLNEQLETFVEGARKIKRLKSGYAAIMVDKQLALIGIDGRIESKPGFQIPTDINTGWTVVDKHVYYTTQDQEEINLHQIDLNTSKESMLILDKGSYNGRFSMSADGSKLVRMVVPTFVNTVLKAKLTQMD